MIQIIMKMITINIQGGDSAHYARVTSSETRMVGFPDGVHRLITTTVGTWENFDFLSRKYSFTEKEFSGVILRRSRQFIREYGGDLESEIRSGWTLAVLVFMQGYYEDCHPTANV